MGATGKPSRSSGGAVRRVEAGSVRASTRRCIGSKRRRIAWPWCWVRKPEGLDVSAAERVFGIRHATITRRLVRAGAHAQTLHERSFSNLVLPHLQLDELRMRLRSHTQVLWLWVAIDPLDFVHSGAASGSSDPPHCLPAYPPRARTVGPWLSTDLHQRWPQCVLLRPHRSFWVLAKGSWEQEETVAGGDRLALWPASRNAISGASWCESDR